MLKMCSQVHATHLANTLWMFKQENVFCDTTIHAQNGVEIYVHSAVLGAVSTKLRTELQDSSSWITGDSWNQCRKYQLYLFDCKPVMLNTVLQYIYTGHPDDASDSSQFGPASTAEFQVLCERLGVDASLLFPTTVSVSLEESSCSTRNKRDIADVERDGKCTEGSLKDPEIGERTKEADTDVRKPINDSGSKEMPAMVMLKIPLQKNSDFCQSSKSNRPDSESSCEKTIEGGGSFDDRIGVDAKNQNRRRNRTKTYNLLLTKRQETISNNDHNGTIENDLCSLVDIKDVVKVEHEEDGSSAVDSTRALTSRSVKQHHSYSKTGTTKVQSKLHFRCCLCSKCFTHKAHLQGHMKSHLDTKPYVCVVCQKTFKHGAHLRQHYIMHSCESPEECKTDLETVKTDLEAGKTDLEESEELKCSDVAQSTDSSSVCDVCHKGFSSQTQLKRHAATHSIEHCRHQCTKCGKSFMRKALLVKHEMLHTDVRPLTCSTCHESFHTEAELAEHVSVHTGIQPHVCHVCGKRFALQENLKHHESVHLAKKTYHCKVCNKSFKCLSYLKSHQKGHDGIKPFMCDVCGKGFLGSSNLKTHRRIHTGERPYACSYCDKRFLQICAVKEHEKIHLGNKQFVCDTCGKMFMTYAQLYNHLKIHIGIKAFVCDICNKRFFTNGDMTKHQRIHKDQRPFVCNVCGKGFKYSSNLHGHSRIHSGTRPYICKTCGKDFTYSSHLSRHSKLHTREKIFAEEKECNYLPVTVPSRQVPDSQTTLHPVYLDSHSINANLASVFPVYAGYDVHMCN